ncbi:MAG: nuclear transport factor 2 family protein [Myxococcota bacterium]
MKRTPEEELLAANAAFYDAFATGDIEAMDELWARTVPVACVHPGWPALHGREEVMQSWRSILLGEAPPEIRCEDARASLLGAAGTVVCVERIGGDALVASNVFVLENGIWQVAHHQAGPLATESDAPPPGQRLN